MLGEASWRANEQQQQEQEDDLQLLTKLLPLLQLHHLLQRSTPCFVTSDAFSLGAVDIV